MDNQESKKIGLNYSEHDMLVRISTTLESLTKSLEDERERTAVAISRVENKADSAHIRLDGVVKFQYLLLGGAGALGLIATMMKIMGKL